MSNFTSDEEVADGLEIKPPQAHVLVRRREKRGNRDRYRNLGEHRDRRGIDDDRMYRSRRGFEQNQPQSPPRESAHRYARHSERDYPYRRPKDREVSDGGGGRVRSHGKRSNDKYLNLETKSVETRDRVRELLPEKRIHTEPEPYHGVRKHEEDRHFVEGRERKRDRRERQQHRDRENRDARDNREVNRAPVEEGSVKRSKAKSPHTPTSPPVVNLDTGDEDEPKLEVEITKEIKSKSGSSALRFPEIEDIDDSLSEREEGEASPGQTHSDVSASEDENFGDDKSRENSPRARSVRSKSNSRRGSSSSSDSDGDSDEKTTSEDNSSDSEKDADSGDDDDKKERRGNGREKSSLFKPDSPGSPISERRKKSSHVDKDKADKSKNAVPEVISVDAGDEDTIDIFSLLPPYHPAIQGCRRVEEFQFLNRIEEGTYGVVYRARDKRINEIVALKRLKMEKEKDGFPITSLREINTLLKAQHENIVTVREIVVGSNIDKIFLVMDYVEHDLKSLMETLRQKEQTFREGEVKCLMIQLLRAVAHLHDNWILHRDLKTSNLLFSHKGILKVGDFGLAREYGSPLKQYTPIVVTLWYRAPELLLQMKEYSTPIDVWSVGCIFGELLKMEPMFPGKSEANQLNLIFQTLGTPNDKIWPGYSQLPLLQKMTFADYRVNKLKTRFPQLSETGIDLMNKLLTFNPAKRITAEDALDHPFFEEHPLPIDPSVFPTWPAKSELGHRKAAASPKPPSGGQQFKELRNEDVDTTGFFLGAGDRRPPMGPGFTLKY